MTGTLSNLTETLNAINSSSTEFNHILCKIKDEILPITVDTLKEIELVSRKLVISMDAANRLIDTLTVTLYVFMLFLLMIGIGYLLRIRSIESTKTKLS